MRITIVRHGETDFNKLRLTQGHSFKSSLTEAGREQARLLADRLKDESFTSIYSSDLPRAIETTEEILKFQKATAQYRPELRELSKGQFENQSLSEYRQQVAAADDPWLFRPLGGESLYDLERRIIGFLEQLDLTIADNMLICGHRGSNRMLLKVLLKKDFADWPDIEQDNCSISSLSGPTLETLAPELINCTAHLNKSKGRLREVAERPHFPDEEEDL